MQLTPAGPPWSQDIRQTYTRTWFFLDNTAMLIELEVSNFSTPLISRQDTHTQNQTAACETSSSKKNIVKNTPSISNI